MTDNNNNNNNNNNTDNNNNNNNNNNKGYIYNTDNPTYLYIMYIIPNINTSINNR